MKKKSKKKRVVAKAEKAVKKSIEKPTAKAKKKAPKKGAKKVKVKLPAKSKIVKVKVSQRKTSTPHPSAAPVPEKKSPPVAAGAQIGLGEGGAVVVTAPPDQPAEANSHGGGMAPEAWRHDIITCAACGGRHCAKFTSTDGTVPPANFLYLCPKSNFQVNVPIAAWEQSSEDATRTCLDIQLG